MTHYEALGVLPSAEGPVIRSAYRALMRLYHPDVNHSDEAQLRVREITAAFAVLGDPHRRAAYDSQPRLNNDTPVSKWFGSDRRSRPPMRNLGMASVALALAMSLATPLWLKGNQPAPAELRSSARSGITQTTSEADFVVLQRETDLTHLKGAGRSPPGTTAEPVRPPELMQQASSAESVGTSIVSKRQMAEAPAMKEAGSVARATAAPRRLATRKAVAPIQKAVERAAVAHLELAPPVTCARSRSKITDAACTGDRESEIERLASGFLNQSIANADWHKQELLLSARNRAAFSRATCHSDECVIGTYIRQIRETTEIMQGRVPRP